jgi:SOS-response transcriptional repressor LexA
MKIEKLPLTAKQKDVLGAIETYIKDNDISPNVKEILAILSVKKDWKEKSLGAVQSAIIGLIAKGWVRNRIKNRKSRKLEII